MRAQEFILESKTASADVVWNYVKRIHPDDQQGGGFLEQLIRQYPQYRLQAVPVTSLIIHDQESDDPDQEPEEDPYGRVQVVDPDYAGEISIHNLDRNPIVIDAQGHILDGNHRAWAAAELLGRDTIRAWVPVEQIDEIGNTRPEYTRPDKQRSGNHKFTTRFTGARGKQRQVDVYFMYDYNTLEIDFKVDGRVNSYVTGGGDAVLILSAVRHIVEQELPKILKRIPRLKQVRFRSYAEEQSRVSLYLNRAVPMVSRILGPDWRYYGDFMTMGDSHWFYWQHRTVTGMDRVRVHGREPQEQPDEPYDVGETERFRQAWEKKQQQGVAEGSLEEISRRGFLGAIGAAALTGAAGVANANPYQLGITDPEEKLWKQMNQAQRNQWVQRQKSLEARCWTVYRKLRQTMPPEDKQAIAIVSISVPLEGEWRQAGSNYASQEIYLDLGTFWDLSDDCLAYTIGHEMGHMVWGLGTKKGYKGPGSIKSLPDQQRRQNELDADVYGALLAYRAGYDYNRAWDGFTREKLKSTTPDSYYPTVPQRQDNAKQSLDQFKQSQQQSKKLIQGSMQGIQKMADYIQRNSQTAVAEGLEQINEYRDRLLQYVKSLLPTWPDYVLKDWLVPNKGDFSNLPADAVKTGIMEKLQGTGLTVNTKWQLVPDMKFTMDMFNPKTKQLLIGRAGGHSDLGLGIPRDKERHATQAALAQQQGGIRKEPVILIKSTDGYELLEGWHRTIQHFASYPNGYVGPAYVAVSVK
jgi:hypothetical protein